MNLLLDTHIALWAISDSPKLSAVARALIESPKATIWISTASLWEIAIKHGLGRGDMPISSQEATAYFTQAGYHFLDVQPEHAVAVEQLAAHHQDPFDRMLIAQAMVEPMRLLTHDAMVARYSDTVIKV